MGFLDRLLGRSKKTDDQMMGDSSMQGGDSSMQSEEMPQQGMGDDAPSGTEGMGDAGHESAPDQPGQGDHM
jgi:hypothetical protein